MFLFFPFLLFCIVLHVFSSNVYTLVLNFFLYCITLVLYNNNNNNNNIIILITSENAEIEAKLKSTETRTINANYMQLMQQN